MGVWLESGSLRRATSHTHKFFLEFLADTFTMELGSNFSAKLEPFLLIAKSLKGAAAAKLIQDATSAPGVFVFSELLELPNIQEVREREYNEQKNQ